MVNNTLMNVREINFLENLMDQADWIRILVALGVFVSTGLVLSGVKALLRRNARRYSIKWAEEFLENARFPVNGLIVMIALGIGLQLTPDLVRLHPIIQIGSKIGLIVFGVWILDRFATGMLRNPNSSLDLGGNTRAFLVMMLRVAFFSITLLIVLDTLGISITPLLASLGVGSVAVALALQDTLSNFFSGIYLLIDKPFRVGDYVKVEPGAEGVVRSVGWRTTQIDLPSLSTVFIPNSKLSQAVLTNFDLPERATAITLQAQVSYEADLDRVEKIAMEVAKDCLRENTNAVSEIEPIVRFQTFGTECVGFAIIVRAKRYTDNALLRHELIKKLHARFVQERIGFSSPRLQKNV